MTTTDGNYRKILNGMSKAFVIASVKGHQIDEIVKSPIIDINGAFEVIFGIKMSEATGRELGEIFKMMLPKWFEMIASTCLNNETTIFECGLTNQLTFYKTEAFMIDTNTLALIIEDITDLKQANEQIKFQAFLLENINCAIGATDFNGHYIYWNKHMETLFQWKKEEIIGKHILEVRLTEDMKTTDQEIFEQLQKTGYMEFEAMCPKKDKTAFPAHIIVASLKNEANDIIALVGIHTDITEQKKLEDAMKLCDERWKFALEGSGDGVFDYNVKTQETHYSDKWKLITGVKAKDDSPDLENWLKRICLEDRKKTEKLFFDHIKGKSNQFVCEHRILVNGIYKWCLTRAKIIVRDDDGAPVRVIGTLSDINELKHLEEKYEMTKKELLEKFTYKDIVGRSPQIIKIKDMLPTLSAGDCNILIEGPSGTGKNLVAKTIHSLSERRDKPLMTINCGALPENLLESELFGYVKGAFTDAKKDRPGKIQSADGGIVFLDEIGDLPLSMQVKLLHFIEEKRFEPLGSDKSYKADVRIIAATNRNLLNLVKEKKFREDLFYRLKIVHLIIPHLKDRFEDIELLISRFLIDLSHKYGKNINKIATEAYQMLLSYDYPGNVRELYNMMEHAFLFCKEDILHLKHFAEEHQKSLPKTPEPIQEITLANESRLSAAKLKTESQNIAAALKKFNNNRNKVAEYLKVSRVTLWRLMKKYGFID